MLTLGSNKLNQIDGSGDVQNTRLVVEFSVGLNPASSADFNQCNIFLAKIYLDE